jgi:hypothetical protein
MLLKNSLGRPRQAAEFPICIANEVQNFAKTIARKASSPVKGNAKEKCSF